ncbi:DUF418 domain-containing protein [Kangiella taiwanensis]|uniref:DUF418 domain-containing protein n=1 Tax=Kangiella taiwanensis TaxID=1079179 RepID=A0ABP8I4G2_9GAMM|nr:DUF418 domain-containing protein [Kangiella taiwanensis]
MTQAVATEMKPSRLTGLDVLRGIVILSILIININYFSTPDLIRYNPMAFGEFTDLDKWVWFLEYSLVKQRFMTLLALLYGVGILLFATKYEKLGVHPTKPFFARSLLLLVFGLAHAYLIWDGDILVAYAICGGIVFWLRALPAVWLVLMGLVLTFGVVAPNILSASQAMITPPETPGYWLPGNPAEAQQYAVQKYQGSWWSLTPERIAKAWERQSWDFIYFTLWRCCGLMLLGMGLWKWGALQSERVLKQLTLWGLFIGLIISLGSTLPLIASDFDYAIFVGINSLGFYIGSIVLALGYLGLVLWWGRTSLLPTLKAVLAKAGRMAFTLYIMQSLMCAVIFYGYGFDLYGKVSRSELWVYVVGIWVFQLTFAVVWFQYFKRGPLEAVWRKGYEWVGR